MSQFVERLLQTPEVRGSNTVIGKLFYTWNICLLQTVNKKPKNKEKRLGMVHKKTMVNVISKQWLM